MPLKVSQKFRMAISTLKGPLWVPLIEKGGEKIIEGILTELGGEDPQATIAYDIMFFRKGCHLLDGGSMIVRLGDKESARALCERLNHGDEEIRELTWLNTSGREHITGEFTMADITDHTKWIVVDYYDLRKRGEGMFWVVERTIHPK